MSVIFNNNVETRVTFPLIYENNVLVVDTKGGDPKEVEHIWLPVRMSKFKGPVKAFPIKGNQCVSCTAGSFNSRPDNIEKVLTRADDLGPEIQQIT